MRSSMLVIGITLSFFAIVHAFIPMLPIFSAVYAVGAALALFSLVDVTKPWVVRLLAVASTVAMFLYFFRVLSTSPPFSRQLVPQRRSPRSHRNAHSGLRYDRGVVGVQLSTQRRRQCSQTLETKPFSGCRKKFEPKLKRLPVCH
jgi:hypothetical protein